MIVHGTVECRPGTMGYVVALSCLVLEFYGVGVVVSDAELLFLTHDRTISAGLLQYLQRLCCVVSCVESHGALII